MKYPAAPGAVGLNSPIHSITVGSSSMYASEDVDRIDPPSEVDSFGISKGGFLARTAGVRSIPRTFARPWPIFDDMGESVIVRDVADIQPFVEYEQ